MHELGVFAEDGELALAGGWQANGEQVGQVDRSVLGFWALQRHGRIPGRLLMQGRKLIAVRVFDQFGDGACTGPKGSRVLRRLP